MSSNFALENGVPYRVPSLQNNITLCLGRAIKDVSTTPKLLTLQNQTSATIFGKLCKVSFKHLVTAEVVRSHFSTENTEEGDKIGKTLGPLFTTPSTDLLHFMCERDNTLHVGDKRDSSHSFPWLEGPEILGTTRYRGNLLTRIVT